MLCFSLNNSSSFQNCGIRHCQCANLAHNLLPKILSTPNYQMLSLPCHRITYQKGVTCKLWSLFVQRKGLQF